LPFSATSSTNIPVIITGAYVFVYYNSSLLASNDLSGTYTNGVVPIIQNIPVVNVQDGFIQVQNLNLYTFTGYVLDVKFIFTTQDKLNVKIICNPSNSSGLNFSITP
jgi:hypothetical protein